MQKRQAWIASLTNEQALALQYEWDFWARNDQRTPLGDWLIWLVLAGRGWGKTRAGAQTIIEWFIRKQYSCAALIGATAADVRDVMIGGPGGIMACSPPWYMPTYQPSNRRIVWPDGRIARCYSAEEPKRLRGPQHDCGWFDELAAWNYPDTYDQAMFGMRMGSHPRVVITTTPQPKQVIRTLVKSPTTRITRGSTHDNIINLAPTFAAQVLAKYEGTRMGRQEIHGELLDEYDGALWKRAQFEAIRVYKAPPMKRVVIGVDPAATSKVKSNNTGIIGAGLGEDGLYYVLEDATTHDKPSVWAGNAVATYHKLQADRIVAEVNNGGDMVEACIRVADPRVAYKNVHAARSKKTRAEPIAALYEQNRVRHVGTFPHLEDEMVTWDPLGDAESPDRCFVAGTSIATSTGPRPIETIQAGDRVMTSRGLRTVLAAGKTADAARVMTLHTDTGAVTGTPGHPVFVANKGFCPMDALVRGDALRSAESSPRMVRSSYAGIAPVYGMKVHDVPEFYANGILVHNCDALVWALTDLHETYHPSSDLDLTSGSVRPSPYLSM